MGVIIDKNINNNVLSELKKLGINYYKSFDIEYLYKPVNTHPDMQIHFFDNKTAIVAPIAYEHYKAILPNSVKLIKGTKNPNRTYPGDCAYNIAKMGKKIIGNLSYTDPKIIEVYSDAKYKFINVKQGYTKCNLCIIDDNSAITEDEGIYKSLCDASVDVLLIKSGCVSLSGFDRGFIGGASGMIDSNTVLFCGNLREHPDYISIKSFIVSKSVDIKYLSSTKLCDYGSLLYFDGGF